MCVSDAYKKNEMKKNHQRNYLAIAMGALCVIAATASEDSADRDCYSIGPDVVSRFWDSLSYGSVGDIAAFSFGTDACNIGDEVLDWVGDTSDHPVISSAIYRLKNGRFEQVGVSWLKHGFAAAQSPNRCDCECDPPNDNQHLGIGCADAYSATTNGIQSYQGPRSQVNAFLGLFPFPPSGWGQSGNEIFKRLQVHHSDLEPSSTTGTQYFGEIQYVSAHDSLYGNHFNNSTWQPITVSGSGSNWHVSISGDDHVGEPVLQAWSEMNPSVRLTENRPLGDGTILTAVLVSQYLMGGIDTNMPFKMSMRTEACERSKLQSPLVAKSLKWDFMILNITVVPVLIQLTGRCPIKWIAFVGLQAHMKKMKQEMRFAGAPHTIFGFYLTFRLLMVSSPCSPLETAT